MTRWREVRLAEHCEIVSGATPRRDHPEYWGGNIAWVTPKDLRGLDGPVLENTPEKITKAGYESCSTRLLPAGSVLFSSRAPIGLVAITGREMCTNQGFKSLIPGAGVDAGYLYWCLKREAPRIDAQSSGTTFSEVSRKGMERIKIPLPPLPEQRRIAAILDKADAIRRKRQQTLDLADQFLRSAFLDMFGDPVTNPKGWDTTTLGDVVHAAQDGPHVSPEYADDGVPFLSTRHIKPHGIVWKDLRYITREKAVGQWRKCKPQRGDVLYTKGGTTGIAAAVDFDREIAVWVHVAVLKTDQTKIAPAWLTAMLNTKYCYAQSQRYTHGITNKDLGLTRMVKIKLYLPPLAKQKEYAEVARSSKLLRAQLCRIQKTEYELSASLVQRAFRGAL